MASLDAFEILNSVEQEVKDYPFYYSFVSQKEWGQNGMPYGQAHFNLNGNSNVTINYKFRKDSLFLFLYFKIQVAETSGSRRILGVNSLTPAYNYLSSNLKVGDVAVTFFASGGGGGLALNQNENIQASQGLQGGQGSLRRLFLFPQNGMMSINFQNNSSAAREISGFISGRQIVV